MAEAQVATKSTPKQKPAAKAKKADMTVAKPDLVQTKATPALLSGNLFQSAKPTNGAGNGIFRRSVQTKLKVGQPGDKYEQEADAVADQVVQARFQSTTTTEESAPGLQTQLEEEPEVQTKSEEEPEVQMLDEEEPQVQAKSEEEAELQMMAEEEPDIQAMAEEPEVQKMEEEPQVQAKPEEEPELQMMAEEEPDIQAMEEEPEVQAMEEEPEVQTQKAEEEVQAKDGNGETTDSFDNQLGASSNGGSPLSQSTIGQVEPHLGADLSGVRVHTDSSAVQMNQQLGSQAFTHKNHVYFNEGKYNPGSSSGDHLIAHELTHTVQQGASVKTKPEEETEDELQTKAEAPEVQKQLGDAPTDSADAAPAAPAANNDSSGSDTSDNTDNTPPPASNEAGDTGSTPPSAPPEDNNSGNATEPIAQDAQDLNKDNPIKQRGTTKAAEGQKVEKLALEGSSEESMASFTKAGASKIAASLPGLGEAMSQKLGAEKTKEAAEAPVLTASTTGVDDPKAKPANAIGAAKNAALNDGVTEPEPAAQQLEPHKEGAPLPKHRKDDELDKDKPQAAESGGFFSWLFDKFKNVMGGVSTKDNGLNTKAGKTPKLDATGQANPERTANQTKEGKDQVNAEKDKSAEEIKKNPGQENIQPQYFEVPNTLKLNAEIQAKVVTEQDAAMADFVDMPMPEEVRTVADLDMAPTLEKSLLQPREQTQQAALKRDTEKQAAIADSEAQVEQMNKEAEQQQKKAVDENRKAVADEQQRGINEANTQMNAFTTEADKEQGKANKAAKERIAKDQGDADKKMKQAEADAAKEKKKGEAKAKAEKEKAKKNSEDKSWWGKFKDAVSSAVSWLTEAIGAIFKAIREAVKFIIDKAKNAALALIEAGRKWVVEKLEQFGSWLKEKANKYLAAFPALRDKVNGFIDKTVDAAKAVVNKIADGLKAGVEALANALTNAINAVLNAFETALTAAVQVAGAMLKGDFTEALKIAFFATCKVAGIDPNPIMEFINNAGETINIIFKDPAAFFGHVASGVKLGLDQFVTNIKKHLISGLIGWLTGAMSDVPIQMPQKFDLKGVFSLVMQILGLTYDRIRAKVVKRIGPKGEQVVSGMEQGFQFVKDLVTKGPIVLYEKVQDKFTEIKEMAIEKIRNLVTIEVVKAGIKWLIGLLNPASAIVKAVLMLFDFVMFLVDKKDQIMGFVSAVFGTVGPLARGQIKTAANAVEGAMGRGVPLILGLLANLAGLGGIGKSVAKVIKTIQKPVDKVVDPIIGWLVKQGKKLFKKGKAGVKKLKDKVFSLLGLKKGFKGNDGKSHTLFFKKKGKNYQLTTASTPTRTEEYVKGVAQHYAEENTIESIAPDEPKGKYVLNGDWKAVGGMSAGQIKTIFKQIESEVNLVRDEIVRWREKEGKQESRAKSPGIEGGQNLSNALNKLGQLLASLPPSGAGNLTRPKSKIRWPEQRKLTSSTVNSTDGETMVADVLSSVPGSHSGSAASFKSELLKKINQRGEYVAGHLLHDKLYGPGNKAENLAPITGTSNTNMSRNVEDPVLDHVFKKNRVVKYTTTMHYPSDSPGAHPIPEEAMRPTKMTFSLKELEYKGPANDQGAMQTPEQWGEMNPQPADLPRISQEIESNPAGLNTPLGAKTVSNRKKSDLENILRPHNHSNLAYCQYIVQERIQNGPYDNLPNFKDRLDFDVERPILSPKGKGFPAFLSKLKALTDTQWTEVKDDIENEILVTVKDYENNFPVGLSQSEAWILHRYANKVTFYNLNSSNCEEEMKKVTSMRNKPTGEGLANWATLVGATLDTKVNTPNDPDLDTWK